MRDGTHLRSDTAVKLTRRELQTLADVARALDGRTPRYRVPHLEEVRSLVEKLDLRLDEADSPSFGTGMRDE